jgi:hypothetical protein
MILSINNKEINENELSVNINSTALTFNSKKVRNGPDEPILIFIYNKPRFITDNDLLSVSYNNISKTIKPEFVNFTLKHNLVLTTLFKDDYKLFTLFYEYYKKQGVEHFYMYYNGIVTEDIKRLFNYEDVKLISWDFIYWNILYFDSVDHIREIFNEYFNDTIIKLLESFPHDSKNSEKCSSILYHLILSIKGYSS